MQIARRFETHPCGGGCGLASAYAYLGRAAEARAQFDWVARDDFAALPEDLNWLAEMGMLADTAISLNDAVRGQLVYERLAPFGDQVAFFVGEACPAGPVAHWLCELSTTQGEFSRAAAWLERARGMNQKLRATMFLQHCSLAEARLLCLSRSGSPQERGNQTRARALLADVIAFADAHGIKHLRTCALLLEERLLHALAEPASAPSRDPQLG